PRRDSSDGGRERPARPAGDTPQLDFGDRKRSPRDGDRPTGGRGRSERPSGDKPDWKKKRDD
ncbi:MAG: hypothetical protein RL530_577, partial [Actinomycetota bacterium]